MIEQAVVRRPRLRRTRHNKPRLVLQNRDREIVRLVVDYRMVSSDTIAGLMQGSKQGVLRRLQVLYHAGYLDRPRRQGDLGNVSMVYAPGPKTVSILGERVSRTGRDWAEKNRKMGAGYIDHQVMLSRFRAILVLAGRENRVEVERWQQGVELWDSVVVDRNDFVDRIPVAPDAYCVLRLLDEVEGSNRIHCFIEVDRSTMTTKRFLRKLEGYWWYWRSGRLESRFGIRNALVVTVTRTWERARNLKDVSLEVDHPERRGLRMFLFGSEEGLALSAPNPILDARWLCPEDGEGHSLTE